MMRIKSEVSEMKNILKMYRKGNLSEEKIAEIEASSNMPIASVIAEIEDILYKRDHCLVLMTLARLRRWAKNRAQLSDEEKLVYATVNGITYEEFEKITLNYLERLEASELEKKRKKEQREEAPFQFYVNNFCVES